MRKLRINGYDFELDGQPIGDYIEVVFAQTEVWVMVQSLEHNDQKQEDVQIDFEVPFPITLGRKSRFTVMGYHKVNMNRPQWEPRSANS